MILARIVSHIEICIIICVFLVLTVGSAPIESLTYDEAVHVIDGLKYLQTGTSDIDPYNPPLTKIISALPLHIIGQQSANQPPIVTLFPSRLMQVILSTILVLAVYTAALRLFDKNAALIASLMLIFEPTF